MHPSRTNISRFPTIHGCYSRPESVREFTLRKAKRFSSLSNATWSQPVRGYRSSFKWRMRGRASVSLWRANLRCQPPPLRRSLPPAVILFLGSPALARASHDTGSIQRLDGYRDDARFRDRCATGQKLPFPALIHDHTPSPSARRCSTGPATRDLPERELFGLRLQRTAFDGESHAQVASSPVQGSRALLWPGR